MTRMTLQRHVGPFARRRRVMPAYHRAQAMGEQSASGRTGIVRFAPVTAQAAELRALVVAAHSGSSRLA
jgi:hypothetical protein